MFSYPYFSAYVLGAQKNHLIEKVLLNILVEKLKKNIFLLRKKSFYERKVLLIT